MLKSYYDWRETFTYNYDVTFVIGKRDVGKTFGLREQFLRDYINHGERFCAVCRYKDDIPRVSSEYFEAIREKTVDKKLKAWFAEKRPVFKLEQNNYKIGFLDENGKAKDWDIIGYFAYMSVKQSSKERSFAKVRRFVVDEAIIEPEDLRFRRYLPDEWGRLQSIVQSATKVGNARCEANVYLLGNAVDLINPWFEKFRVYDVPEFGKHRLMGGLVLLDYVDSRLYRTKNDEDGGTIASRMLAGEKNSRALLENEFTVDESEFIEKRTRGSRYECAFIYRGGIYGIWTDWSRGLSYVTPKILKGGGEVYALTTEDNRVNYLAAKQARKAMLEFIDRYGAGLVRFENVKLREGFLRMLRDFGIK